ncbi:MAG TPA: UDP-3-O-(3-hydroxymyristoyl)glucosamine N-acyltransferase [Candidatus Acidoferrales bacterium]|jgi:UDP-3-O-[3-hydroxymyristoyl] glucosamine N-acyltransferase|nr:UDP-3-O-(3-hydroxymyristoyl)glucosamine N-acyltransferase [Candidatus Acidoferrales bacterium]
MKHTAGALAAYLGATLHGDSSAVIAGVASPEKSSPGDLIYLDAPKNRERVANSAARCVLARASVRLAGKTMIEVEQPKFAFAKAAAWLTPQAAPKTEIHPAALVPKTARLGANVTIGPYVVIEDDVQVGEGTIIDAFCFLGRGSVLGKKCRLHPRVTFYPGARIGDRVEIHSGAVIGGDGFGYVFGEGRQWKFPQIGSVSIGDDVEVGCNTTVDRGSLGETHIASGVKIDNLVQVAHNVQIGEHTVIAAQTGISGSTSLGKRVAVGGQAGIGDHCRVEDEANVGGQAGVVVGKTVRRGQTVWGTPARPLEKFKEQYVWFARLPELAERVRKLEESEGKEKAE